MRIALAVFSSCLAVVLCHPLADAQVRVRVVAAVGDTPAGAPGAINKLDYPTVGGEGHVGFTGEALNVGFVWINDGIVWLNSDGVAVGATLTGSETTCGIGSGGDFIYSPTYDGNDSVWSHNGLLMAEALQAPGFPAGTTSTFNSRPYMTPTGAAYWVSGYNASAGSATEGRMLYKSSDATPGNIEVVMKAGDLIGGTAIKTGSAIGFDYHVSDDDSHVISEVLLDTGSTVNDATLLVDGVAVASEDSVNGDGDNWDNFDLMVINNDGNYMFSGDTDGVSASDEFIAYNGTIVLREGDVVDSRVLGSLVRGIALNNDGVAAFGWNADTGETVFAACSATDLTNAGAILSVGDTIDVDGDGMSDGVVLDLDISSSAGRGLALNSDGMIYVRLSVDLGSGPTDVIAQLDSGCVTNRCGNGDVDPGEVCDDYNNVNGDGCSADCLSDESCGNNIVDLGEVCDDGGDIDDDGCSGDCQSDESCGNGIMDTGETCDDGNNVNGDGCSAGCVSDETCGNGVVDTGETCDDNNVIDGDGCSADCNALEYCGNGVMDAGETCDDGNNLNGDGCSAGCSSDETCGNGIVDVGEICDDGNTADGDGCAATCETVSGADSDEGGCGCGTNGGSGAPGTALLLLLGVALTMRRRR